MNDNSMYLLVSILIMALITFCIRGIPFIFFGNGKKPPQVIVYIGKYMPPAVIAMLVIYCLKNISIVKFPFGIPEMISVLLVVMLHIWKRNNLLSILGGTVAYMIVIQIILK